MQALTLRKFAALVALAFVSSFFVACDDDDDTGTDPTGTDVPVPTAYTFESRFEDGVSSVSYPGQTVRNLQLQDLKIFIDNLAKDGASGPITMSDLMQFYAYEDAMNLTSLTTAGTTPILESEYSEIATDKNLVGKISPAIVVGTDKNADEHLRAWFEIIVDNSADGAKLGTPAVYTTDDGVDLTQMINKLLLGAVPYYQATDVYLGSLLDRDNSVARERDGNVDPFTDMEHAWDEAFGYFGAARNYSSFTDEDLAGSLSAGILPFAGDANSDGRIDFRSEYNFGFSRNAGKRDKGGTGVDYTSEIFAAALTGRTLIVNQATTAEIREQQQIFAEKWEEVIAATIVHYTNETLSDYAAVGGQFEDRVALNKHWAEMRGFTMALQYNPLKQISDSQLTRLAEIMQLAPPDTAPGRENYQQFLADYNEIKTILQSAYGFSSDNMDSW